MDTKDKKTEKINYPKRKALAKLAKTSNHAIQSNLGKAGQNAITNMSCYRCGGKRMVNVH